MPRIRLQNGRATVAVAAASALAGSVTVAVAGALPGSVAVADSGSVAVAAAGSGFGSIAGFDSVAVAVAVAGSVAGSGSVAVTVAVAGSVAVAGDFPKKPVIPCVRSPHPVLQPKDRPPVEGRILAGRYRLIQKLGQGGMGAVWRAQHLELGTHAAIKLLDPDLAASSDWLARFRREAQAAASLHSPNIVNVFDFGVDQGIPYIAMEFLQGETLAQRLAREKRLSPIETATILQQVARAVAKAHDAGIVHRDLKPDNVFLVRDDELEIAKVLDFGIAKRTSITGENTGFVRTETGAMLGTPLYMSPEQAGGKKDIDHLTDIWSFGVIACECLIGARVFNADTLGGLVLAICSEPIPIPSATGFVTSAFDAWFFRCIARDRSQRFQSIRDASAGLVTLLRGESTRRDSLNDSELSQHPTEHAGSPAVQATSNAVAPNSDSMPTGASLAPNFALTQPPSTDATGKQYRAKVPRWIVPVCTGFAVASAVLVATFVWLPTPNGDGASASGRSPLVAVDPEPAQIASSQAFGLADAATTLASPARRAAASAGASATPSTPLAASANAAPPTSLPEAAAASPSVGSHPSMAVGAKALGATSSGSVSSPSVSPVPAVDPSRSSAASAKSAVASTRPIPNSPRPVSSPAAKASLSPSPAPIPKSQGAAPANQSTRARSKIDLAL